MLKESHFFGTMQVKQSAMPERVGGTADLAVTVGQEFVKEFIAQFDEPLFISFFGKELLALIKADPSDTELEKIIYGEGDFPISCLANFVYYNMISESLSRSTERGSKTEDRAFIATKKRIVTTWNAGVDLYYQTLVKLIDSGYTLSTETDSPIKIDWYG